MMVLTLNRPSGVVGSVWRVKVMGASATFNQPADGWALCLLSQRGRGGRTSPTGSQPTENALAQWRCDVHAKGRFGELAGAVFTAI